MSPVSILLVVVGYFFLLLLISYFTGRKADNKAFFVGNKQSPWYVVAFGMVGASLSGVTFISVPGWVKSIDFTYMQMVFGYMLGYVVVANILLPLYYKLNLTSIYSYLDGRFGKTAYKTGASFFLLSRTIGASFRLFLMANVLQITVFDAWNIPFFVTVLITILLIWLYTFKGGIKTIVWTDTLQTLFMLLAVGISIYLIMDKLNMDITGLANTISESDYSKVFEFGDWQSKQNFFKQFFTGAFITIVMTGLDQDMMQKNLSCKNLGEAKKNMYWYGFAFIPANLLFLILGALLLIFAQHEGIAIPERGDDLFPILATQHLGPVVSLFFLIGLMAAAYSSADSALTALTTSFTVDILGADENDEERTRKLRFRSHVLFSLLLLVVILIFRAINDDSVIAAIFTIAGYTYGPLLGLYAFGLFTKLQVKDNLVPVVAILSPIICYILKDNSVDWFGIAIGFELLMINGALTFLGLCLVRRK
ncbi:sodium:solute symporter [Labilibaculum sp. K2S]|uniref:sodium:solute symporter n=1 Tax=Labilibaculum sp. K2S TaxID=3056386 RepID=UPI0025A4B98B|nr:sodium:solute symporter [Labilibaculum sp. K2S]MDM8158774.1 sodium:solute symporter [Labilibaculum sp. K2S]